MRFVRIVIGLLLATLSASSATIKLYLKDGSYQLVREYRTEGDRIKYYSTERGEWEEIPLDLVDLPKTQSEVKSHEDAIREETATQAAEEKAERDAKKEVERVPVEQGVYLVEGESLKPIKAAEAKVVNNTRRSVLKVMSPLPIVTGKQWLEVDGLHSSNITTNPRPEFYIRLAQDERFGMVRMGEHKGNRVIEKLTIIPVTKEVVEEPDLVETFRRQVADGLFKIWPEKDLTPGEYAVVEYTDGKVNIQTWDFAYKSGR
jgi:hypothetical protein